MAHCWCPFWPLVTTHCSSYKRALTVVILLIDVIRIFEVLTDNFGGKLHLRGKVSMPYFEFSYEDPIVHPNPRNLSIKLSSSSFY